MGDYSHRTLAQKLGVKSGTRLVLVRAPGDFLATLGVLPDEINVSKRAGVPGDLTVWFVRSLNLLTSELARIVKQAGFGPVWIVWPKKAAEPHTDLTQPVVRKLGLKAGLVDYKICRIDETWSGLLFKRRQG